MAYPSSVVFKEIIARFFVREVFPEVHQRACHAFRGKVENATSPDKFPGCENVLSTA
jgi:hypothetical protein